jgi:hypothetical protein
MAAELGRRRRGKATKTHLTEEQLGHYASAPVEKLAGAHKKHAMRKARGCCPKG